MSHCTYLCYIGAIADIDSRLPCRAMARTLSYATFTLRKVCQCHRLSMVSGYFPSLRSDQVRRPSSPPTCPRCSGGCHCTCDGNDHRHVLQPSGTIFPPADSLGDLPRSSHRCRFHRIRFALQPWRSSSLEAIHDRHRRNHLLPLYLGLVLLPE